MQTDPKICLECGDKISGRSDKKFCSDLCRNSFNNKQNQDQSKYMRRVNGILRRNRKALHQLFELQRLKVYRKDLAELDFNFTFHTDTYQTKTGNVYHFCYDYGLMELKDGRFLVVKRKDELQ